MKLQGGTCCWCKDVGLREASDLRVRLGLLTPSTQKYFIGAGGSDTSQLC